MFEAMTASMIGALVVGAILVPVTIVGYHVGEQQDEWGVLMSWPTLVLATLFISLLVVALTPQVIFSTTTLVNVGLYIVAGLLWSVVQFCVIVWKVSARAKKQWAHTLSIIRCPGFLDTPMKCESAAARIVDFAQRFYSVVEDAVGASYHGLFKVEWKERYRRRLDTYALDASSFDTITLVPSINGSELRECIVLWTFFWPFALLSTLIGDVVVRTVRKIASLVAVFGQCITNIAFRNTFKN